MRGSVSDGALVERTLRDNSVDGVIHLAALKAVGESVAEPMRYYRENVGGMATLLDAMRAAGTSRIVYSSSAAVYGTPDSVPILESALLRPESPYGETKVVGEWLCSDAAASESLSWTALRYFNVAGAASDDLGDTGVNNLIPMVLRALDRGERPQIFGDDYPTPDGTCIRDYIHVEDLAEAHVAAAALTEGRLVGEALNIGRGEGSSVREMMDAIGEVLGRDLGAEVVARRAGDPPESYADTERATEVLGWRASRDLRSMITSAWSAWQAFPPGDSLN